MFKEGFASLAVCFCPFFCIFRAQSLKVPCSRQKCHMLIRAQTAKAPSRLTTRRGFADFKKGEEFLIKYYPRFLSTNAAAASMSIAGAMLIAGAPVFGFFSPLLSPLEAII